MQRGLIASPECKNAGSRNQRPTALAEHKFPTHSTLKSPRYGVEDTRMAVTEAKMQGMSPFCLTVDRQASDYLPGVFGVRQYALMPRPELLPTVLLDWIKRLVSA